MPGDLRVREAAADGSDMDRPPPASNFPHERGSCTSSSPRLHDIDAGFGDLQHGGETAAAGAGSPGVGEFRCDGSRASIVASVLLVGEIRKMAVAGACPSAGCPFPEEEVTGPRRGHASACGPTLLEHRRAGAGADASPAGRAQPPTASSGSARWPPQELRHGRAPRDGRHGDDASARQSTTRIRRGGRRRRTRAGLTKSRWPPCSRSPPRLRVDAHFFPSSPCSCSWPAFMQPSVVFCFPATAWCRSNCASQGAHHCMLCVYLNASMQLMKISGLYDIWLVLVYSQHCCLGVGREGHPAVPLPHHWKNQNASLSLSGHRALSACFCADLPEKLLFGSYIFLCYTIDISFVCLYDRASMIV